jgi:hypothetical protein
VARLIFLTIAMWAVGGLVLTMPAQNPPVASTTDAFFAGTVMESTSEKITVVRTVRGQAESRSFRVTPQTKVDGRLSPNVRVTVRYASGEEGDTATMIIVRPPVTPPPAAKKK